ncbi:30S ribosomal protein S20 [Oceanobacillus sp. FSL H7-0719]|uniref:30S ribosomal protein S20 n=1 Tax=Oceanobacillus sp. FSL H7-0719 TaxID=2954507 RepID=UPI003248D934
MANIKSAIKRVETNEKKRSENQSKKSDMRTAIKQVEKFVEANDVENAKAALKDTVKKIDKVVQKGIIHKNNGERQKTRLSKKVNELGA